MARIIGAGSWVLVLGYSISCAAAWRGPQSLAEDNISPYDAAIREYAGIGWSLGTGSHVPVSDHSIAADVQMARLIGAVPRALIFGYSISCAAAWPCAAAWHGWRGSESLAEGNISPNNATIREYARIEWHGSTATLIAGGSRPLDMAARTLATCLDVSVSAEDPQYRYLGDLLDLTAPQWSAQHPAVSHMYAAKPARLEITFGVYQGGRPKDLRQLLQDAAQQINRQQPYAYTVLEQRHGGRHYYNFVPTRTRSETGALIEVPAYLDRKITIPRQTDRVASLASEMSEALSRASGLHFNCCQGRVGGLLWGTLYVTYHAFDLPAREVLEDLMDMIGITQSYSLRCEPLDKQLSCSIDVITVSSDQKPGGDGVCAAGGFDAY